VLEENLAIAGYASIDMIDLKELDVDNTNPTMN
jgi:hypothetical protein